MRVKEACFHFEIKMIATFIFIENSSAHNWAKTRPQINHPLFAANFSRYLKKKTKKKTSVIIKNF